MESAVRAVLAGGHRTRDLAGKGQPSISTQAMGEKVATELRTAKLNLAEKIS